MGNDEMIMNEIGSEAENEVRTARKLIRLGRKSGLLSAATVEKVIAASDESFRYWVDFLEEHDITVDFDTDAGTIPDGSKLSDASADFDANDSSAPVVSSLTTYLAEIGKYPLLGAEEEHDLFVAYRNGDMRAKKRICVCNLRLAAKIAFKFKGCNNGLDILDLIQEANMGMMRAVEKFDPARGFRFSTCATWWIRQGIIRSSTEKGHCIRIPTHMNDLVYHVHKAAYELTGELGCEPTPEEIAARLKVSVEKVKTALSVSADAVSLDKPINDEDSATIRDLVANPDSYGTVSVENGRFLRSDIDTILTELPEREQAVITMRYGLHNTQPHTLDEIGQALGITRERVRQLEQHALRALLPTAKRRHLKDYLDYNF